MSEKPAKDRFRITLVSAPWPLFSRPSIQLGALKAYLNARFSSRSIRVEADHFYLEVARRIGYRAYHDISQRMWTAEAVFAALLDPGRHSAAGRLFRNKATGKGAPPDFDGIVESSRQAASEYIRGKDWNRCGLVGFSMCLCQTTATLYLIRKIKERCPTLPVIVGGGLFDPGSIPAFFRIFPEIDAVAIGEGERPLERVVAHLVAGKALGDLPAAGGVITRAGAASGEKTSFLQVPDLDRLPDPDFDDYFKRVSAFGPDETFFPTLPAEISRGCWWQRRKWGGEKRQGVGRGCAFCVLNLQWAGYRSKTPQRAAAEIDRLTSRYRTLSVALTDNLLPRRQSE